MVSMFNTVMDQISMHVHDINRLELLCNVVVTILYPYFYSIVQDISSQEVGLWNFVALPENKNN